MVRREPAAGCHSLSILFKDEAGLPVDQPESNSNPDTPESSILIAIAGNNDIWIERRLIDPRAVRANIERLRAENRQATVVIQADKRSHNDTLVQVMDAAREAGIYDVSLAR